MYKHTKGVTPVTGIIIVLLVTAIFAGFLAIYTIRLHSGIMNVPSADFAASDCPEPLSSGKVLTVTEISGGNIAPSTLRFILKNETSGEIYILDWNGSAYDSKYLCIIPNLHGEYITPGDKLTCYCKSEHVILSRTKIHISIVYKPAGVFLFRSSVWVE